MIGAGVQLYIYIFMYMTTKKSLKWDFIERLTFSNTRCRLALPLRAPEPLFSLSKSKISLLNVHLALFVRRMTQLWSQNHTGKYYHLVN